MNLTLSKKREGRVLVARLAGELDHHTTETVRNTLDRELDTHPETWLILDLGDLTFMDSSGLGVILGRYRKIKSLGGEMALARIPQRIEKVVQISGLKKIMLIYATSEEAQAKMGKELQ